jgi:hypothetical protein
VAVIAAKIATDPWFAKVRVAGSNPFSALRKVLVRGLTRVNIGLKRPADPGVAPHPHHTTFFRAQLHCPA